MIDAQYKATYAYSLVMSRDYETAAAIGMMACMGESRNTKLNTGSNVMVQSADLHLNLALLTLYVTSISVWQRKLPTPS